MFVYQQNGMQYLPLEYIAELLHLPIQVDIDTLSANGWFIEESHLVDISQDLMVFRNISDNCDKSETIVYHDSWDLYIESRVLEQLLGLAVSFDSARQKFDIQASKHIPLTLLLERQKRFELFNAQKKNNQSRPVKKISKEYALLGDLAVNADIGVRTQSLNDIKHTEADAFLQTRADLLGHNTYAAYSQSASGSSFNAYLERELQEQWVNFYRIGNVDSHSLSLVSDSVLGVGAIVSAGSTFTGDLRSIVVEGELDPDWDVELYRNNTLVGVQRVKSDGQYRFADVPYYIGLNQYQLRFYGPNGEIRTESFSKLLDSSLLEKGNVGVNFGAMARELDDLKQYYADVNWALADDMTVGLALVQQQNTLKEWQFLPRLSVNFVGDSQLVQLNYVNSPTGYATSVAIQGSQSELDWQAEWQKYSNYSTWDNIDGRIDQEALINISGSLDGSTLNWGFGARWQAVNLGSDNTQANFLLSSQFNALSLSNDLRWSSLNSIGRWSDRLAISGRINNWQIRSYVDLDIAPELSLNQWNTNFNTALTDRANYQLELGYQPNGSSDFTVRNSISYLFDYGALRLELDNRSNGDWLAQMKWNSAFLWDTEPDRWLVDRMSYINTGSVKIIAFQDDNANGLFDDIELPISGLKFTGHSQSNKQTDLNGELLITQLQTNRQQKLVLNENSLKDPFLLPAAHIISVNPHPGHIQPILFPVMYTAELEGEVVFDDKDNSPASGVFVELRAKSSDISNSTRVEYDGIFILDQMLPGEYELFINDIFIQTVKLTPGDFIQLPKFTIERQTNS
ncbi:hypothetical protein TUM4438_38710 [Shewanella sairae]|uniref:Carboxypeptidase regulatory-like domain-containing protein n=2 Tax=Shewanella sairae TaxID=190310 RepID=A0ABQ4PPW0_9GAMM|nr:hypothetical protein TUM4438_38710 [Shewanella sairae]